MEVMLEKVEMERMEKAGSLHSGSAFLSAKKQKGRQIGFLNLKMRKTFT